MTINDVPFDPNMIAIPKVEPSQTRGPRDHNEAGSKAPRPYKSKAEGLSFYKLQTLSEDPTGLSYRISKFDSDLEVLSSYIMNWIPGRNGGYHDCQCPASRFDCRHKAISKTIVDAKQLNSDRFYCFEAKTFKLATEIGRG